MELALSGLDWFVCTGVLLASILFGLYMSARAKASRSSEGFFLAGRSLTWPVVGASLFATIIGAEHLVGLSGDSYRYGLCAGTVELTTALCLGFAMAVLLPHYVRNNISPPRVLERRYNGRPRASIRVWSCVYASDHTHSPVRRGLVRPRDRVGP